MRGRTRGSGDGEEKRLMKNEDFREQTAFSIYIVCLIKIFDSGKGAEQYVRTPQFIVLVMHFVLYFRILFGLSPRFSCCFFSRVSTEVYGVRTTLECRHSFVVFFLFFWSNL